MFLIFPVSVKAIKFDPCVDLLHLSQWSTQWPPPAPLANFSQAGAESVWREQSLTGQITASAARIHLPLLIALLCPLATRTVDKLPDTLQINSPYSVQSHFPSQEIPCQ